MKKIVIAIDSFKGCLSSVDLANAAETGIKELLPKVKIQKVPIADGGEGTVDALINVLQGEKVECIVDGPLRQPIKATYGWLKKQQMAIIEMAVASGLSLIPWAEGNVMRTTSYGTGQLITDAIRKGCRHFLLTIGGSATNDAGLGMLQALGFRFLDELGNEIGDGGEFLQKVTEINEEQVLPELHECRFQVATDVKNPFYGPQGAAYIFSPQKGATPEQVVLLDHGLRHFARLLQQRYEIDVQQIEGSGAAGGLGGSCRVFLQAELLSGVRLIKELLHFDELIKDADLLVTGEGKIDKQTSQGKVVAGVLESAKRFQVPVVALTGNYSEENPDLEKEPLLTIFPIHAAPLPLEQALEPAYAYRQVERSIKNIIKLFMQKR